MKKTPNQEIITSDILRYKTNKLPATLALLGIAFGCLYFCLLYGFKSSFFAMWKIGISVVLTLVLLLVAFLCSEGIKSYKKNYSFALLALALLQIIRMFGLPFEALKFDLAKSSTEVALSVNYFGVDLSPQASYVILVIWLAASAACFVASAVLGYINCTRLESFQKKIDDGEVVIEDVLAEMDKEDAAAAINAAEKGDTAESIMQNENTTVEEGE